MYKATQLSACVAGARWHAGERSRSGGVRSVSRLALTLLNAPQVKKTFDYFLPSRFDNGCLYALDFSGIPMGAFSRRPCRTTNAKRARQDFTEDVHV